MTLAARIRGLFDQDRSPKTNKAIAIDLGVNDNHVRSTMGRMADAYILEWLPTVGQPAMVWMVVEVPKDAPKPKPKKPAGRPKAP